MKSLSTVTMVGICIALITATAAPSQGERTEEESLRQLQAFSDGFAAVAARVSPGVVSIVTEQTVTARRSFHGTPWEFFGMPDSPPTERRREGQGSGVIVPHEGGIYILTNYHVVRQATEIRVELTDERYFEAEVVGADSLSDLAVLKIEEDELPSVPWGRSEDLRVGEWVLAVGNPFGQEHSVTAGIVSAKGRARFGVQEYGSFIQTDAAINPGNSGGALVNLRGELVGINTAIFSRSGGYEGIGFAIPVDLARDVLRQLVEYGEVRRGWLGVGIKDLDEVTAEALGMENTRGVFVRSVIEDGPAEKAGVEQGDVILAVNGTPTRSTTDLKSLIGASPPGTKVRLRLRRDQREKEISLELGQLTEEMLASARPSDPQEATGGSLGLRLEELTPELARQLKYDEESGVVVVAVQPGSRAQRRGFKRGHLILAINGDTVQSIDDFERIVEELDSGTAVKFLVRGRRGTRFIFLRLP